MTAVRAAAGRGSGPDGASARLSVLWHPVTFAAARSAYVADLENLPELPAGFARWVDRAIAHHAGLTRNCRAVLSGQLPEEPADDRPGVSRSFVINSATVAAMVAAMALDARNSERITNRNRFAAEAVRAAVERARRRNGGTLPPPPARLPSAGQRG